MEVGLVDVDSLIPNLALMKISSWHKSQGDNVKFFEPLFDHPDIVYASKIFDFTPDYPYFPDCEIVRGGPGYDINAKLPEPIECAYPDYGLYNCEYAIGRITRGCPRRCPWCIVWKMDGKLRQVAELSDFCREQHFVRLLDDNILGDPELFDRVAEDLQGKEVYFDALDIRFVNSQTAAALAKVDPWRERFHFSWDGHHCDDAVPEGIATLERHGIKPWRLTFYVLIGFETDEKYDLYRVETLRSLGANPFVMPYDKSDRYQRDFARWVNRKVIFKSCTWGEYRGSKRR